jgi:hypothetical protein
VANPSVSEFIRGDVVEFIRPSLKAIADRTCRYFDGSRSRNYAGLENGKHGRSYVVMDIAHGTGADGADLYILAPIAEGPAEHCGKKSVSLPKELGGIVKHKDTKFHYQIASAAHRRALHPFPGQARLSFSTLQPPLKWLEMQGKFDDVWTDGFRSCVDAWNSECQADFVADVQKKEAQTKASEAKQAESRKLASDVPLGGASKEPVPATEAQQQSQASPPQ